MFTLSSLFSEFSDVSNERDASNNQANKGFAISFPTTPTQYNKTYQASEPLIEAVERFGVMKCSSSSEQSLIHGDEQESKPSVTFPLTLNTPFQFTQ